MDYMTENINYETGFLSLYEFLKRPAGPDVGKQVAKLAMQHNEPIKRRQVDTPKYKGDVLLYRKNWLYDNFRHLLGTSDK